MLLYMFGASRHRSRTVFRVQPCGFAAATPPVDLAAYGASAAGKVRSRKNGSTKTSRVPHPWTRVRLSIG